MLKFHTPQSIAPTNGSYSHGVEVPPNSRLLYVAGQIPVRMDGSIPESIEEQTEIVWRNILAILAEAGMSITDVVKINSYLTRAENFARFAATRAKFLSGHKPASTTAVVTALAKPEFLIEVEAIAAKAAKAVKAKAAAKKKTTARTAGESSARKAKKRAR